MYVLGPVPFKTLVATLTIPGLLLSSKHFLYFVMNRKPHTPIFLIFTRGIDEGRGGADVLCKFCSEFVPVKDEE